MSYFSGNIFFLILGIYMNTVVYFDINISTQRNSVFRSLIPILIPPSSATLKVLDVLKLISGIWNKLLKIKLVMKTIWGELRSRIVSILM